ncbi:MAG: response regulator transcription factor [Bacteroidota bacterium]
MKTENKQKILLVDDDKDILDLLQYNLEREGYIVKSEINSVTSFNTALEFQPDLIILDIMMSEINGIELCKKLREDEHFKHTYIFFLTAKSEKHFQLEALQMGGDDYIPKMTGLRALTYKVSAVLKKSLVIRKSINEIKIGNLLINRSTNKVTYNDKSVLLSQYEFELLYFFAQNPRKVISQDNILNNIWGSDIYVLAKSVDTYINSIRKKLGAGLIAEVKEGKYKLEVA